MAAVAQEEVLSWSPEGPQEAQRRGAPTKPRLHRENESVVPGHKEPERAQRCLSAMQDSSFPIKAKSLTSKLLTQELMVFMQKRLFKLEGKRLLKLKSLP